MMYCPNCEFLLAELKRVEKERDEAKESANRATDLMMKGEALRGKMMLEAILGDFPPKKEKKA